MRTFRGEASAYGCAFCGGALPFAAPEAMLALVIPHGGRETRLWAPPACLRARVTPDLRALIDAVPPAQPDDIHPTPAA